LSHLKRLGPLTMNELSEITDLEHTTLIRNLKLLEKKKSVHIHIPKSAKAHLIQLTNKGQNTLNLALPYWQQAQRSIKELLTKEESELKKSFRNS